jgi:hypothetical protein
MLRNFTAPPWLHGPSSSQVLGKGWAGGRADRMRRRMTVASVIALHLSLPATL